MPERPEPRELLRAGELPALPFCPQHPADPPLHHPLPVCLDFADPPLEELPVTRPVRALQTVTRRDRGPGPADVGFPGSLPPPPPPPPRPPAGPSPPGPSASLTAASRTFTSRSRSV